MKSIALLLVLAAAGCKKDPPAPPPPDCATSINQGMDKFAAKVNASGTAPQMQQLLTNVVVKLRATLISHCTNDKWAADKIPCFATVSNQREVRACEDKLTPEQATSLRTDIQQTMMGMRQGGMGGMNGMPGHPQFLAGHGSAAGSDAAGSAATGSAAAGSAATAPSVSVVPSGSAAAAPKAAGSSAPAGSAGGGW